MKLSKSILIFLFLSSVSGAFFYALNRTDGNIFKSLLFALFVLTTKICFIAPNISLELNQDQQLVSRVGYNPYVSILDDYHPSGLLMDSIERS